MRLTRTKVFIPSAGDRPGVRDLAIIITDGNPNREVTMYFNEVVNFRVSVLVTRNVTQSKWNLCA